MKYEYNTWTCTINHILYIHVYIMDDLTLDALTFTLLLCTTTLVMTKMCIFTMSIVTAFNHFTTYMKKIGRSSGCKMVKQWWYLLW